MELYFTKYRQQKKIKFKLVKYTIVKNIEKTVSGRQKTSENGQI